MRYIVPALLIASAVGGMLAFWLAASWEHLLPDAKVQAGATDPSSAAATNIHKPVDDHTNTFIPLYQSDSKDGKVLYLENRLSGSEYIHEEENRR